MPSSSKYTAWLRRMRHMQKAVEVAREAMKRAAYLATLPKLPYLIKQRIEPTDVLAEDTEGLEWINFLRGSVPIHDMPGYSEHNRIAEEAARERRLPPKLYLFDADAEEGADDRLPPEDNAEMEFTEWPEGFPPSIPTD